VDAAITKLIRLMGHFTVVCGQPKADERLRWFLENVPVSGTGYGMGAFVHSFMDSLLTYGNALGEVVLTENGGGIYGLYNSPLDHVEARRAGNGLDTELFVRQGGSLLPVLRPELVLFAAHNPKAGQVAGRSLLEGLPFVTGILLQIYDSIGKNFERVGNLRFAVTYHPPDTQTDRAYARERAQAIAKEWSNAISSESVKDFVAVGDVDIKVIGADNQVLDTQVPVRQMLEQMVAKLGVPPFLLGLNWSTTERMSSQQSDILTSELESYQGLLTPIILRICRIFLRLEGFGAEPTLEWHDLSMQDVLEGANARLANAQAARIEHELEGRSPVGTRS